MRNSIRTDSKGRKTIIKIDLGETLSILDEADNLIDLGEIEEGRRILAKLGETLRSKVEGLQKTPARDTPKPPEDDRYRSMTLETFCEVHRIPLSESERKAIGGRLRRYCDRHGVEYGEKVFDGEFWNVRAWPVSLLSAWRKREINLDADPNWKPKPSPFRNADEVLAEIRRQRNTPIPDGVPKPPWIE